MEAIGTLDLAKSSGIVPPDIPKSSFLAIAKYPETLNYKQCPRA